MATGEKAYADGDEKTALQQFLVAAKRCDAGIQGPAECADTYHKLATVLRTRDPKVAIIYYRKAITCHPRKITWQTDYTVPNEAATELLNLAGTREDFGPALKDLCDYYFALKSLKNYQDSPEEGDYTTGCLKLRSKILEVSGQPQYLNYRIDFLRRLIEQARVPYDENIFNEASWDFRLRLGQAFLRTGDYIKATEQFRYILMHEEPRTFELASTMTVDAADGLLAALKGQKDDAEYKRVSTAYRVQFNKCGGEKIVRQICTIIKPAREAYEAGSYAKAVEHLTQKKSAIDNLSREYGQTSKAFFKEIPSYIYVGTPADLNKERSTLKAGLTPTDQSRTYRGFLVNNAHPLTDLNELITTDAPNRLDASHMPDPSSIPLIRQRIGEMSLTGNLMTVGLEGFEGLVFLKAGNKSAAKTHLLNQLALDKEGIKYGAWTSWDAPGRYETYPALAQILRETPESAEYISLQERLQTLSIPLGCFGSNVCPEANELITGPVTANLIISNPRPKLTETVHITMTGTNIHFFRADLRLLDSSGKEVRGPVERPAQAINSGGKSRFHYSFCPMDLGCSEPIFVEGKILPIHSEKPIAVARAEIKPIAPYVHFIPAEAEAAEGMLVNVKAIATGVDQSWKFDLEGCDLSGNCFSVSEPEYKDGERSMMITIKTPGPTTEKTKLDIAVSTNSGLSSKNFTATFTLHLLPKSH
jgi:tetratricopeptide (TPR) repeat protein